MVIIKAPHVQHLIGCDINGTVCNQRLIPDISKILDHQRNTFLDTPSPPFLYLQHINFYGVRRSILSMKFIHF